MGATMSRRRSEEAKKKAPAKPQEQETKEQKNGTDRQRKIKSN